MVNDDVMMRSLWSFTCNNIPITFMPGDICVCDDDGSEWCWGYVGGLG